MLAIVIICILVNVCRIAIIYEEYKKLKATKNKNKPTKTKECIYCDKPENDHGVISSMRCTNPDGKDLSELMNPNDCIIDCDFGIRKVEGMNVSHMNSPLSLKTHFYKELILLFSSLIPAFIAIYKLM